MKLQLNSTYKRLLIAGLISSTGFATSYIWYQSGLRSDLDHGNQKPIARLVDLNLEVQRKPIKRVIWQNLNKDALLYAGEAIRTAENSEAKIEFIQSGTVIDLEPESLVVLQESEGKVALDFMQGNLFVKAGENEDGNLTLKSGNNQIKVGQSELSLGKEKNGNVNLQVTKGNAVVQANGKETAVGKDKSGSLSDSGVQLSQSNLKVVFPKPGQIVYVDPNTQVAKDFEWEPLPDGFTMDLETGNTRNKLTKHSGSDAKTGKTNFKSSSGAVFWRLTAKSKDGKTTISSPTFKNQVLVKAPVQIIAPENNGVVVITDPKQNVEFRWSNPAELDRLAIEIAKKPNLTEKVLQNQTLDQNQFEAKLEQAGMYYYRVTGYLKNSTEYLSTPVMKFELKKQLTIDPPVLKLPIADNRIPIQTVATSGLFLTWNPSNGAVKYKVKLLEQGKPEIEKETTDSMFRIKEVRPGQFQWSVVAINEKGEVSKNSEVRKFSIQELPVIQWANQDSVYEFVTEKPSLKLSWLTTSDQETSWQYRVALDKETITQKEWKKSTQPNFNTELDSDGAKQVEVQALNKNQEVVAKSTIRNISVLRKPLLPAPIFVTQGEKIEAQKNGSAKVEWKSIDGAKQYVMTVKDPKGSLVKEVKVNETTGVVRNLMPGDYKVQLQTIDQYGRTGPVGETKNVVVPQTSDVAAPKVRALKIK